VRLYVNPTSTFYMSFHRFSAELMLFQPHRNTTLILGKNSEKTVSPFLFLCIKPFLPLDCSGSITMILAPGHFTYSNPLGESLKKKRWTIPVGRSISFKGKFNDFFRKRRKKSGGDVAGYGSGIGNVIVVRCENGDIDLVFCPRNSVIVHCGSVGVLSGYLHALIFFGKSTCDNPTVRTVLLIDCDFG
jgi:hypothetical protein